MDFFTSDLHFGHRNIIKHCDRPFSNVDEMNSALINNWNSMVNNDDRVIVVGDMFLCGKEIMPEIMSQLNGYKILVKGNHDLSLKKMKEIGFDECHRKMSYTLPGGQRALVQHHPIPEKLFSDHDLLIHGHIHISPKVRGKRINVSCDIWDFSPIQVNRLCGLVSTKKSEVSSEWCDIHLVGENLLVHLSINMQDFPGAVEEIYKVMQGRWPRRRE